MRCHSSGTRWSLHSAPILWLHFANHQCISDLLTSRSTSPASPLRCPLIVSLLSRRQSGRAISSCGSSEKSYSGVLPMKQVLTILFYPVHSASPTNTDFKAALPAAGSSSHNLAFIHEDWHMHATNLRRPSVAAFAAVVVCEATYRGVPSSSVLVASGRIHCTYLSCLFASMIISIDHVNF